MHIVFKFRFFKEEFVKTKFIRAQENITFFALQEDYKLGIAITIYVHKLIFVSNKQILYIYS